MQSGTTDRFESNLEELGLTSERVALSELTDAIVQSAIEPAVSTKELSKNAWLSDTAITVDPTPSELSEATTGITEASFGIADYGSIYLPQDAQGTELISLFVDHHIAVIRAADIVPDMSTAFELFDTAIVDNRGSGIIATGPSATADMGELVRGAHGPKSVHVIILEEGDF